MYSFILHPNKDDSEKAFEILGLNGDEAKKQIQEKYRNLLRKFKNDQGLLAKINKAKQQIDQLLLDLSEDPYKLFGLSKDATVNEINKAFRQIALKCHPDKYIGISSGARDRLTAQFQTLENMKSSLIAQAESNAKQSKPKSDVYPKSENAGDSKSATPENNDVNQYISMLRTIYKYKGSLGFPGDNYTYIQQAQISKKKLLNAIANKEPLEKIEEIIKAKECDINELDSHGNNAIHLAIALNNKTYAESLIRILVQYGCDVCHRNRENQSPVYFALHSNQSYGYWRNYCDILHELGVIEADMKKYQAEYVGSSEYTSRRFYRSSSSPESSQSTETKNSKPQKKSPDAPLFGQFFNSLFSSTDDFMHYGMNSSSHPFQQVKLAGIYIKARIEIYKKSKNKVVYAIANNHSTEEIQKIIDGNKMYLNVTDKDDNNLVHIACMVGRGDVLLLLHKLSCDFEAKNKKGLTACAIAVLADSSDCLRVLSNPINVRHFNEEIGFRF